MRQDNPHTQVIKTIMRPICSYDSMDACPRSPRLLHACMTRQKHSIPKGAPQKRALYPCNSHTVLKISRMQSMEKTTQSPIKALKQELSEFLEPSFQGIKLALHQASVLSSLGCCRLGLGHLGILLRGCPFPCPGSMGVKVLKQSSQT